MTPAFRNFHLHTCNFCKLGNNFRKHFPTNISEQCAGWLNVQDEVHKQAIFDILNIQLESEAVRTETIEINGELMWKIFTYHPLSFVFVLTDSLSSWILIYRKRPIACGLEKLTTICRPSSFFPNAYVHFLYRFLRFLWFSHPPPQRYIC